MMRDADDIHPSSHLSQTRSALHDILINLHHSLNQCFLFEQIEIDKAFSEVPVKL